MKCIDFDEQFSHYIKDWIESVIEKGMSMDEAEDRMPEVYERFLDTPAAWLNGVKPGEYFLAYDDPVDLIRWLAGEPSEVCCYTNHIHQVITGFILFHRITGKQVIQLIQYALNSRGDTGAMVTG